jgi:hypothetical protein
MAVSAKDLTYPEILCPECLGECYVEMMTYLSYDGWSRWKTVECEECHGNGWIYDEDAEEVVEKMKDEIKEDYYSKRG